MDVAASKTGERLAKLRADLSKRLGTHISQKDLAKAVGIQYARIERIENGRCHITEVANKLYEFYYKQGYNIFWIIAEDNSGVSMYRPVENDTAVELSDIVFKMSLFKHELLQFVDANIEKFQANSILNR